MQAGLAVREIQDKLPNARVVYCSATGVSDTSNMAYMGRLGLWGIGSLYADFENFSKTLDSRGMGAMEMLAGHLKVHVGEYRACAEGVSVCVHVCVHARFRCACVFVCVLFASVLYFFGMLMSCACEGDAHRGCPFFRLHLLS